jgi:DNA invertase Pin-like site-specific DNA recombinase
MNAPAPTIDVYARVSRIGDDRQRSTTGQIEDCTAIVADRGAHLGEVHIDPGRSAWRAKVRRPGWDRLMERLESGATGGVIIWDLTRFSRRPIEGERLIAAAESGLLVLDSEGEYDLTSPSGKKAFRHQMTDAANQSDQLSRRVKRGKKLKAQRGERNVSTRPFGFDADGSLREDEAAVIREAAARLLAGGSLDGIVVDLNKRRLLTAGGKEWNRTGLRKMMLRESNAGKVIYRGVVVSRLAGDPILDDDTHGRVVALFASRRRGRPNSDTYLCSGIAQCGLCGHRLTGRPTSTSKRAFYPDGEVRRMYWCQRRPHNGGCGRIYIDQRDVDRHVKALAVEVLADPRHADAVEALARAARDRRQEVEASIAEYEHLAEVLSERLGRGEIRLNRYDQAVEPLDRKLAVLRAELAALEDQRPAAPPGVTAASRAHWEARWESATVTERRALVRQALRGRRLVIGPADPQDRMDVGARIRVDS